MIVAVSQNEAKILKEDRLTSGADNYYYTEFIFDETWDGFQKTAVFEAGIKSRCIKLTEDRCAIPWELLERPGDRLRIGVHGVKGDVVLPTIYAATRVVVERGASPKEESEPRSKTLYEQIIISMGDLEKLKTKNKDSLVDAINELQSRPSGGGGGIGYNIGHGLKVSGDTLMVDAAQSVQKDNTLPITSSAVYMTVGNINALLETI